MSASKEVMAANIQSELDKRGLNAKDFAATLGFKYSTVLDWLHAKTYPRIQSWLQNNILNFINAVLGVCTSFAWQ